MHSSPGPPPTGRTRRWRALAGAGASVVGADRSEESARRVAEGVIGCGGHEVGGRVDVTRPGDVERMVGEAKSRFGAVNVMVTSAGVLGFGPVVETDVEKW